MGKEKEVDFLNRLAELDFKKLIFDFTGKSISSYIEGIGKPEALKYELTGYWSRRITHEHRYNYVFTDDILIVASLKGHYEYKNLCLKIGEILNLNVALR